MTATTVLTTSLPSTGAPGPRPDRPGLARSPVNRTMTGVAAGTVAAARFAGHFVAACVSVAVLGADADL